MTQVARALKHAHAEGFVHRDIKPANVFLTKDEDGRTVVKLLDFGIARSRTPIRTRSPFATAKDTIVGTPAYMSPEQTIGHEAVDHRCDLWSLAVVAYEALSGAQPFEGETLQDILISIGIGRQTLLQDGGRGCRTGFTRSSTRRSPTRSRIASLRRAISRARSRAQRV